MSAADRSLQDAVVAIRVLLEGENASSAGSHSRPLFSASNNFVEVEEERSDTHVPFPARLRNQASAAERNSRETFAARSVADRPGTSLAGSPAAERIGRNAPLHGASRANGDRPGTDVQYSIIIPAYNESARIGATLEKLLDYVERQNWDAEILVVNDGSTDNTAEVVRRYAAGNPCLRLIENPGNRGKGYSVRNGMLQAGGEALLFTDADLSSPIEEAPRLFQELAAGADIAIGSRWLRSDLQGRRQPLFRQMLGRVFNLLARCLLGLGYRDTQCGFKAFTRKAARTIFTRQRIEGWGFDPELLYLARKCGLRVSEVSVRWAHCDGTRISPVRDGLRMLGEMLAVRCYAMSGKYDAELLPLAVRLRRES